MAGILIFVLLLYAMYAARLPFIVMAPIALLFLFVFAGAGITSLRVDPVFTSLMWIALVGVSIVTVIVFWKLRRPF